MKKINIKKFKKQYISEQLKKCKNVEEQLVAFPLIEEDAIRKANLFPPWGQVVENK